MFPILASLIIFTTMTATAQESPGYTICKNNNIVRSIRVEKDSATNEFITLYTKSGKDKEVGRAKWKPSAEKFQSNIKSNLEKAGWKCRDTAQYQITNSNGE